MYSAVHVVVEKFSRPLDGVSGGLGVVSQLVAKIYPLRPLCIERVPRTRINHQRRAVGRVVGIFVHKGFAVRGLCPIIGITDEDLTAPEKCRFPDDRCRKVALDLEESGATHG